MLIDHSDYDVNCDSRRIMNFDHISIEYLVRLGEATYQSCGNRLAEHTHYNSFEFVMFQTGSQNYSVNSRLYHVGPGEMFLTFPNERHGTAQFFEERSHFFYLIFYFNKELSQFLDLSEAELCCAKEVLFSLSGRVYPIPKSIFPMMSQILDLYFSKDPFRVSMIRSLSCQLFCTLCGVLKAEQNGIASKSVPETLERVQSYIVRNLSRKISVAEIAEYVHLSESRIYQIFSESGMTVHDYMLRQKVEIAKEMLYYTQMPVTEIAFQLDFSSSQHLSTVFKKYVGVSPTHYRAKREKPFLLY